MMQQGQQDYTIPVKEDLTKIMEISIVVKENGDFWLLHDRHFEETPDYVEYDAERKTLNVVTEMGHLHAVDLELSSRAHERLRQAKTVFLMYMKDQEKLERIMDLPVIVQN